MHAGHLDRQKDIQIDYLHGKRAAWFAFLMTLLLMIFDYLDRQIIVSMFPAIKAAWSLSDKQLGMLASVVSITVAIGALPVALVADRFSRVKSIVAMASIWSVATISCAFTRNFPQLLVARATVGVGEAGYGSVGAALIASHFPSRMRGAVLAGFFASASLGSVLGVVLGGWVAARWGWQAAFGLVGVPGFVAALLYLKVKDYTTVKLDPARSDAARNPYRAARFAVGVLARSRTLVWICLGASAQLIVVSSVWSWMPSFLNRVHGFDVQHAGALAALVVLAGAIGSVVWGAITDRAGRHNRLRKLEVMSAICLLSMVVLMAAFGLPLVGVKMTTNLQLLMVVAGGFLMSCTVGPVSAVVIEITHPGVRATGSSVLALTQNLLGLAVGPFLTGYLSDFLGLELALTLIPVCSVLAAAAFMRAKRTYIQDVEAVSRVAS